MMIFTGVEPAANDVKAGASKLQTKMQTLVNENLGYNVLQVNYFIISIFLLLFFFK